MLFPFNFLWKDKYKKKQRIIWNNSHLELFLSSEEWAYQTISDTFVSFFLYVFTSKIVFET